MHVAHECWALHYKLNWMIVQTHKGTQPMSCTTSQVMQAGCAYTFSSTMVLRLCFWATLLQAVCSPSVSIQSIVQSVRHPRGFVTGRPRIWTQVLSGLCEARLMGGALSRRLQCLFLQDLAIDLLLKPTHLLLQLTNEIHNCLPDTVGKKELREMFRKWGGNTIISRCILDVCVCMNTSLYFTSSI